jgi:hypothetical protein
MDRTGALYVAILVGTLATVSGYALASIALTNNSETAQGNYVNAAGSVTGMSYTSTVASATPNPAPAAAGGSAATPQALASGTNAVCASPSCTAGDFAQIATYTFTAGFAGSAQISIQVTAASGSGSATLYFQQAGTPVSGTIVIYWDLGSATNSLTATTITVQQCSGASCP